MKRRRNVRRAPLLRELTLSASVSAFGLAIQGTVGLLFLIHDLGLTPAVIGLVAACGGAGSLVGAFSAGHLAQRIGVGRAIILGSLLWAAGSVVMPLAGLADPKLLFVGIGQWLMGAGATIYSVNQMGLRQGITLMGLFGRATAARRVLLFSMAAFGALLGGSLGSTIGLRATLVAGAASVGAGFLLLFVSRVRHVRDRSALAASL